MIGTPTALNSELADAADLIQAEALRDVRDIELTMALDKKGLQAMHLIRGGGGGGGARGSTKKMYPKSS